MKMNKKKIRKNKYGTECITNYDITICIINVSVELNTKRYTSVTRDNIQIIQRHGVENVYTRLQHTSMHNYKTQ